MAEANVEVSVEAALSEGLLRTAQDIFRVHGLAVKEVRFEWIDVSTFDDPQRRLVVESVEVLTIKHAS